MARIAIILSLAVSACAGPAFDYKELTIDTPGVKVAKLEI